MYQIVEGDFNIYSLDMFDDYDELDDYDEIFLNNDSGYIKEIEKKYIRSLIDLKISFRSNDLNFLRSRYNENSAHFEQVFLFFVQSNILIIMVV